MKTFYDYITLPAREFKPIMEIESILMIDNDGAINALLKLIPAHLQAAVRRDIAVANRKYWQTTHNPRVHDTHRANQKRMKKIVTAIRGVLDLLHRQYHAAQEQATA